MVMAGLGFHFRGDNVIFEAGGLFVIFVGLVGMGGVEVGAG